MSLLRKLIFWYFSWDFRLKCTTSSTRSNQAIQLGHTVPASHRQKAHLWTSPSGEWTYLGVYREGAELLEPDETSGMIQATAIIGKKAEASGVAGTPVPRGRFGEAKVPAKIPKNEFSQKTQTWYFCKFLAGTFASNAHCWKVWKFDFNNLNLKGGGCAQAY